MRTFLAATPDEYSRQSICNCISALKILTPAARQRWVKAHNLHLTLCFIGTIDARQYQRLSGNAGIFFAQQQPLTLAKTGLWMIFSGNNRQILSMRYKKPEALDKLVKSVRHLCLQSGIELTNHKHYIPHISLCRNYRDELPAIETVEIPPLHITHVGLYRSQIGDKGADYQLLKQWSLAQIC